VSERSLVPVIGPSEARRLTDEVKRDAEALWQKLVELYDGGAHAALGYSSWQAYCEAEFGFGRSQSYRLLEAGRVAELVPHGGMNERQARELAPLLRDEDEDAVVEVWSEVSSEHGERLTAEGADGGQEKTGAEACDAPGRRGAIASPKRFWARRGRTDREAVHGDRHRGGADARLARLPHARQPPFRGRLPRHRRRPPRSRPLHRAEDREGATQRRAGALAFSARTRWRGGSLLAAERLAGDRRGVAVIGATAAVEAQRILDRAAQRLLAAGLDADSIAAATRPDDRAVNDDPNQGSPLLEREHVPIASANGDRRRGGGD
jgi:hypothetical protein